MLNYLQSELNLWLVLVVIVVTAITYALHKISAKNFWHDVKELADKHIQEDFMVKHGSTLQCPNCNVWSHQAGGYGGWMCGDHYDLMLCKQCGHVSAWTNAAGFLIHLSDELPKENIPNPFKSEYLEREQAYKQRTNESIDDFKDAFDE